MIQHLSEEQKSRWLLGQARDEENEHARVCPICAADLRTFQETVSTYQNVMRSWSEREGSWKIADAPDFASWRPRAHRRELRWILAAAAAGLLLIPAYWRLDMTQRELPAPAAAELPQVDADVWLMEVVSAHLARPVPSPMERVIALLPEMNEREEVR